MEMVGESRRWRRREETADVEEERVDVQEEGTAESSWSEGGGEHQLKRDHGARARDRHLYYTLR